MDNSNIEINDIELNKYLQKYFILKNTYIINSINENLLLKKYRALSEEIKCPICNEIPLYPISCEKCNKVMCKLCSEKLNKCPFNCKPFNIKPINKTLQNMLNSFIFKCLFYEKGCEEKIKYNNFLFHINNCLFQEYKCNIPEVNFEGMKNECFDYIINHFLKKNLCPFCNNEVNYIDFNDHINQCENLLENCNECNLKIKKKDMRKHLDNECQENIIKCPKCEIYLKRKELENNHSEKNCLEYQLIKLKDKLTQIDNENSKLKIENKTLKKGIEEIQKEKINNNEIK